MYSIFAEKFGHGTIEPSQANDRILKVTMPLADEDFDVILRDQSGKVTVVVIGLHVTRGSFFGVFYRRRAVSFVFSPILCVDYPVERNDLLSWYAARFPDLGS